MRRVVGKVVLWASEAWRALKASHPGPWRLCKRATRILTGLSSEPASSLFTQRDKSRFCPNWRPLYDRWKHRYGTWNRGFSSRERTNATVKRRCEPAGGGSKQQYNAATAKGKSAQNHDALSLPLAEVLFTGEFVWGHSNTTPTFGCFILPSHFRASRSKTLGELHATIVRNVEATGQEKGERASAEAASPRNRNTPTMHASCRSACSSCAPTLRRMRSAQ